MRDRLYILIINHILLSSSKISAIAVMLDFEVWVSLIDLSFPCQVIYILGGIFNTALYAKEEIYRDRYIMIQVWISEFLTSNRNVLTSNRNVLT